MRKFPERFLIISGIIVILFGFVYGSIFAGIHSIRRLLVNVNNDDDHKHDHPLLYTNMYSQKKQYVI